MLLERKLIWIFKTIPGLVLTFSTYTMEDLDVSIGMTIECFQLVYCDMNFLQPDNDQKIRQWKTSMDKWLSWWCWFGYWPATCQLEERTCLRPGTIKKTCHRHVDGPYSDANYSRRLLGTVIAGLLILLYFLIGKSCFFPSVFE